MSYISFQPKDYFNTLLYTDNGANRTLTGVGFQPDWVWIKTRNHTNSHNLFDAVRGANKVIRSNQNYAEATTTDTLTAFTSDGFSLGVDASGYGVNYDNKNEVAWNWKANGAGSANTDGNITSTVSTNTTAGFSIVKYTGDGTTGQTVGHGLGSVPKLIINKQLTSQNWFVYHHSIGNTKVLKLNTTDAETTTSGWNNTTPTNSVFTIGTSSSTNVSGVDFINYCFAEKKGFSKFGKYTGNGNANGSFIYTGFKPAFVIIKNATDGAKNWVMLDNRRPSTGQNPADDILFPNTSDAEVTSSSDRKIDFLSNGFKIRGTSGQLNGSGNNHIFMAFAAEPLVASNGTPATAR